MNNNFKQIENKFEQVGITPRKTGFNRGNFIKIIENKLNCELPSDYKMFLLNYGRVNFEKDICYKPVQNFPWFKDGFEETFTNFYGIEDDYNHDILINIKTFLNRMPQSVIPIAYCLGGNQICIGIQEKVFGKVFLWDHEKELGQPLGSNMYLISNSFYDFVMSFRICKNEHRDIRSKVVKVEISPNLLEKLKNRK